RDNESLSLSILRLIEEEALKENTQEVHAIVPVPIASYLLNEKRTAVNAIETRQDGVRCVIVPNDQMETPHYSVLRVRKGEETPTLSYMLPKLHEEAMALPSEEEYAERKRPEQPALATFAMPDVPPAPTPVEPAVSVATAKKDNVAAAQPAQPGLFSRFLNALKQLFSGEETKAVETAAPKAEEKAERQQDRRKPRQNNRRDRNERRDTRDNRAGRDGGESRDDNRRNRRQAQQQNAETRDTRQQETAEKVKTGDEQQQTPRRERSRRRNDDKRQAQQEVKALNREEQPVQETEQEERVQQVQPRRKQRQLNQKVRFTNSAVVETVDTPVVVDEPRPVENVEQPVPAPRTELAKVDLPVVADITPEQDDSVEPRDNTGMPRRSRRSPRHLRVSGQRRRRYRDERYPTQSPMPLTVACASPEMASGKVWIRYPIVRPQETQVVDEQREADLALPQPVVAEQQVIAATVALEPQASVQAVENVAVEPQTVAEPQTSEVVEVETTHPEVIAAPVDEQPQLIAESDTPEAQEVIADAEPVAETADASITVAENVADVVVVEPEEETKAEAAVVEHTAEETVIAPAQVVEKPQDVVCVDDDHNHASAPMTRAPAPEYVPETPHHSDWQRPSFHFEGKGAAGGHSATRHASAPATRPQPVE
ncbi:ribonuclease E, partial [Salmonella enterica subsp. enterica serovar Kentucky]|nr:ribonuclease E [Salmonella enterica subsp. enterica serovar Kentucky]